MLMKAGKVPSLVQVAKFVVTFWTEVILFYKTLRVAYFSHYSLKDY
jgi:hypothetical protein